MMLASETLPYEKKFAAINGYRMAYVDEGSGSPIVFLHGNPTSSFLWRNIMPYLEPMGRLIAPDLIGMGDSDKLEHSGPDSYTFAEHQHFLFALLEHLDVSKDVTLVIHDWGSALGFHWAAQNPGAVKGIAFMEAIVAAIPSWDHFPEGGQELFQGFRSPAGEEMILDSNLFVEALLPSSIQRTLTDAEMTEYRRPFLNPGEDRRPTLSWPRQIPIGGEPADVAEIVTAYANWLASTKTPKLFVNAEPGALISGPVRDLVRSWPNVTEISVKGTHFVQEDAPDEIGAAVAEWYKTLE